MVRKKLSEAKKSEVRDNLGYYKKRNFVFCHVILSRE
jgi:hypothetical protein